MRSRPIASIATAIVSERCEHGKVGMTMVATKIDRRGLSDDLFKPPADYKEMKMPTMPGH